MDLGGGQIKVRQANFSKNLGNFDNFGGLSNGIWQLREGGVVNFPLSRPKRGSCFSPCFTCRPLNQYFLLHLRSLRLMEGRDVSSTAEFC